MGFAGMLRSPFALGFGQLVTRVYFGLEASQE
jgi:hypothetical protein